MKSEESHLARDLAADRDWIIDHFGTISQIFATRKPEVVANQIIHFTKEHPFDENQGRESYVSFIIENLFDKGDVLEDQDTPTSSSGQVGAPPHWAKMTKGHLLVDVDPSTDEFADVVANCTIPVPITKVVRIQNIAVWRRFLQSREEIKEKCRFPSS